MNLQVNLIPFHPEYAGRCRGIILFHHLVRDFWNINMHFEHKLEVLRSTCFPCFGVVQLALWCYGAKPCQHGSRHHDSSEQLRHAISCYTMLHIKKQGAMFGHESKAKIGECNRICEWSSLYGFLFAGAAQHHLLNNNKLEATPIFKTWACGTLQTGGTEPFER